MSSGGERIDLGVQRAVPAYVLVTVEPGRSEEVIAAVRGVKGVTQAHLCWGQPDIFAFAEGANDRALAKTVLTAIQGIPGGTKTHIVAPM